MTLCNILRPAPHIPVIEDASTVKSLYHYWRIRIFYSMFIGYAIYYFTRKSFTFAMPGLLEELELDTAQVGLLSTIFSLTYGPSKFFSGILSDRSNARYFMAFGLFMTGVFNILFGMSSSLLFLALFWGLNGWFQGFGWPPCARYLMQWYSHSERGAWWSSWNAAHNIGGFLIPWIVGAISQHYGWRYAMYAPGWIAIGMSFFLLNRLRDMPGSLGLPPIEKFRNDYPDAKIHVTDEETLTTRELLIDYVLKNPYIWLLGISYFFVYAVRTGFNDWTALFLRREREYSLLGANGIASVFEVGGIVGSLAAGWSSDYLFGAKRGPVNVLFAFAMIAATVFFWAIPPGSPYLDLLAVFLLGFTVFGPQMLIGVAAAELSHKQAAATATGFIAFIAYLGAATAGYPLGRVIKDYQWEGFFIVMFLCCIISCLLLLPLWNVTHRSYNKDRE